MGEITIKEVITRKDLTEFINLPSKIHKDEADWLPPIYQDEWELFDRKRNKSFQYADAVLYLAFRGRRPVGRIMALVNNRYNSIHNEKHGRFCFMESYDDREAFHALIDAAERWVREKGMTRIVGPLAFSDKDPQGFQIEGFEYPQIMTTPTNSPYMPKMLEWEGYTKEVDLVNYLVETPPELPELYKRVYSRLMRTNEFRIVEFTARKEIKPYIIPVLELMNETFSEIYGFVPLNDREKKDLAKRYLPILDPEFIKIVEKNGEPVAFAIAMPEISAGLKACGGKLFPFGIFRILKELKNSKKLMLMLGGIKKPYRGQGVDVLMAASVHKSALKRNMTLIDSHLILEKNNRMRAEIERFNGRVIKRFRIYQKQI